MDRSRRVRAFVYDAALVSLTVGWYRAVLERLPPGCRLLDVGVGTGTALLAHAPLIRARDLQITGVDVDAAYVEHCKASIAAAQLGDRIEARLESIYDHRGGPYDAVYFSGSFMLLPDPAAALRHVSSLLAVHGVLYFTQTFEHDRWRALEILKPLLRLVTTIDFGRVTYEDNFNATLSAAGIQLAERDILHAGKRRSSVLVVGQRPR